MKISALLSSAVKWLKGEPDTQSSGTGDVEQVANAYVNRTNREHRGRPLAVILLAQSDEQRIVIVFTEERYGMV